MNFQGEAYPHEHLHETAKSILQSPIFLMETVPSD